MSAARLTLSMVLSGNERTRPLLEGRVAVQGVELLPTMLHPSEMFWRQLKHAEFDVSEMSLSSLLIATARGPTPWVALPVFTSRMYFHTLILVRRDRGIRAPADLRGKRVGVPEYQQTAALWSRGILEHEFGVAARDIEWHMERGPEKSHGSATGFTPPAGVRLHRIPASTNIGEMLAAGELDATLLYLTNRNLVDRSRIDLTNHPDIVPLFPDALAEGRRFYAKTGIYPINHTVVMRRSLYERHPWLALNLYHGFMAAKEMVERDAREALQSYLDTGLIAAEVADALRADPKAYGVKAARPVLETIARYVHEQGLTERVVGLDEIFAPATLEV